MKEGSSSTNANHFGFPTRFTVADDHPPAHLDPVLLVLPTMNLSVRRQSSHTDVLRSQENPNQFFFYEVYENVAAIDYHKQQPHYNLWADFKASGGVVSSVSHKADGEFMT